MQRMAVMGVVIGIVCSMSACLYFLHSTQSLSSTLRDMDARASQVTAGRIAGARKIMDQELKKKYAEQLSSFARLAQELQNERDRGGDSSNKAPDSKKKP